MAKPAKKKTPAKKVTKAKEAKVAKVEVPEVVEQPAVEEPAQDGAQLTIADLQGIAQVIDMAVRRGAFGASEVSEVGAIYGKLSTFLQVIAAQTKEAEGGQ